MMFPVAYDGPQYSLAELSKVIVGDMTGAGQVFREKIGRGQVTPARPISS